MDEAYRYTTKNEWGLPLFKASNRFNVTKKTTDFVAKVMDE